MRDEEMHLVVSFVEGEARDAMPFATRAEADAYALGFGEGASEYGAGSAYGLTWTPEGEDNEGFSDEAVAAAREKVWEWIYDHPGNPVAGMDHAREP